jgi:outer membrane protein TolC
MDEEEWSLELRRVTRAARPRAQCRERPHRAAVPVRRAIGLAALVVLSCLAAALPVTVEDCIRLALDRAPTVHGATADVDAALAKERGARSAYWPRVSGLAQYGHSEGYDPAITNGGVTQLGVLVEAPILDGGLRVAQLAAARAHIRSFAALEQQRRADVAFAVRKAYNSALALRGENEIRAEAVGVLTDYLDLLKRQEAVGLVPVGDSVRAELALQSARNAARAASAGVAATAHELTTLVGVTIAPDALIESPATALVPAGEDMIERSATVADARAAADAARGEVETVRSENRSHFTISGDAGFLGVNPGHTFRDNGGGEFLFGFSVPLFDGGAVAARVAAATSAVASAEAKVDQERESLFIALTQLRSEAEQARLDAEAWHQALPTAAEAFLMLRARYLGGGSTRLLDVLDAFNQVVDVRLSIVRADFTSRMAAASQTQLVGRVEP